MILGITATIARGIRLGAGVRLTTTHTGATTAGIMEVMATATAHTATTLGAITTDITMVLIGEAMEVQVIPTIGITTMDHAVRKHLIRIMAQVELQQELFQTTNRPMEPSAATKVVAPNRLVEEA